MSSATYRPQDEVFAELRGFLSDFQNSIKGMARVVAEADAAGYDLSWFPDESILNDLRRIGSGQVAIELAERFILNPCFGRLSRLPLEDQRRIATTGKVEVAVMQNGTVTTLMAKVTTMPREHIDLAFSGGRLRPFSEQKEILLARPAPDTDPYEEATVTIVIEARVTKAEKKELLRDMEKAGGPTPYVRKKLLRKKPAHV